MWVCWLRHNNADLLTQVVVKCSVYCRVAGELRTASELTSEQKAHTPQCASAKHF